MPKTPSKKSTSEPAIAPRTPEPPIEEDDETDSHQAHPGKSRKRASSKDSLNTATPKKSKGSVQTKSPTPTSENTEASSSSKQQESIPPQLSSTVAIAKDKDPGRRKTSSRETKDRDNWRCVVTGKAGGVDGCHICSRTFDKDKAALQHLHNLWEVVECLFAADTVFLNRLKSYFGPDRTSDFAWNMITLNKYLHDLWDKCYFGLHPLGCFWGSGDLAAKRFVHVQFVWFFQNRHTPLSRNQPHSDTVASIQASFTAEDVEAMYTPSHDQEKWQGIGDNYVLSGRPIKTGDIIKIRCPKPDEEVKMMDMFKFRWALGKVQFLAGAAGVDFDEFENPDDWVAKDLQKLSDALMRLSYESDEEETVP